MTVIPLAPPRARCPARADLTTSTRTAPPHSTGSARRASRCPPRGAPRTSPTARSMSALSTAKDYLVRSSLDPDVLTGRTRSAAVRDLLDPEQLDQFDQQPRPARPPTAATRATGWLVRFDPATRRSWPTPRSGSRARCRPPRPTRPTPRGHRRPHLRLRAAGTGPAAATHGGRRCSPSGASCTSASTATTCGAPGRAGRLPTSRPGRSPAPRTPASDCGRCWPAVGRSRTARPYEPRATDRVVRPLAPARRPSCRTLAASARAATRPAGRAGRAVRPVAGSSVGSRRSAFVRPRASDGPSPPALGAASVGPCS